MLPITTEELKKILEDSACLEGFNDYLWFKEFEGKSPTLNYICSLLRIVRKEGVAGSRAIIHTLTGQPRKKIKGYLGFPNLELEIRGGCSYDSFKGIVLQYKTVLEKLNGEHSEIKKAPSFVRWLMNLFEEWEYSGYGILKDYPAQISHSNKDYTYAYIDDSKIIPGETPNWDNFESQFTDKKMIPVWRAFCWSVFDPENTGRQILYMYDPPGSSGKSPVGGVFYDTLPRVCALWSASVASNHFNWNLYGKRFLIYPDCKNTAIVKSEFIHALTGNDPLTWEQKFEPVIQARNFMRIIIMSNDAPQIDEYKKHETSRIITIQLDNRLCANKSHFGKSDGQIMGNNSWIKSLKKEFWHFLCKCRESYSELCPTRKEIIIPQQAEIYTNSGSNDQMEEFFSTTCSPKEDGAISTVAVYKMFFEQYKNIKQDAFTQSDIIKFLLNKGIYTKRIMYGEDKENQRKTKCFIGLALGPSPSPSGGEQ
jgi:hypothetical protein